MRYDDYVDLGLVFDLLCEKRVRIISIAQGIHVHRQSKKRPDTSPSLYLNFRCVCKEIRKSRIFVVGQL